MKFIPKSWPRSLFLAVVPFIFGTIVTEFYAKMILLRWFGVTDVDGDSPAGHMTIWCLTAFFCYATLNLLFPKVKANVFLLTPLMSVVAAFSLSFLIGIAMGSMWSGGGGTSLSSLVILIVPFIISVGLVGVIPLKKYSRKIDLFVAAAALALLVYFVFPWQHFKLRMLDNEQRELQAVEMFGLTYSAARNTILNCRDFVEYAGQINQFVISPRRNALHGNDFWLMGYYDFDYLGEKSKGRVTTLVTHQKQMQENGKVTREESLVGHDNGPTAKLYIYPNYQDQWVNIDCPITK